MVSDEIELKAEYYIKCQEYNIQNGYRDELDNVELYCAGYDQGRADALKELEQLQREAWDAALEILPTIATDKGMRSKYESFNDYLSSKSKEGKI